MSLNLNYYVSKVENRIIAVMRSFIETNFSTFSVQKTFFDRNFEKIKNKNNNSQKIPITTHNLCLTFSAESETHAVNNNEATVIGELLENYRLSMWLENWASDSWDKCKDSGHIII